MNILICNVGSTSLKYKLFDMETETVRAAGGAERVGTPAALFYTSDPVSGRKTTRPASLPAPGEAIGLMLEALDVPAEEIACVGFKVVHARGITGVQYLTDDVLRAMEAFNSVAPAHNPPYIAAIRQFRERMPGVPLIGSFETAFHAQMPPEAYLYSIPLEISRKYDIRRYGFHGASHEYMTGWTAKALGRSDARLVSCHLGGSGSLAAVRGGVSIDTTMGMGLQCGVLHNNRIGDIDPYIIFYLMDECGMTPGEVRRMLQTESGLLGLSGGLSGDLRDIEEAAEKGNADAETAVRAYAYAVKKYIGAYAAALGGLDAVTFGGGIGQNSPTVRRLALEGLEFMGIYPDPEKNAAHPRNSDISQDGSPVRIYVVETNEEIIVARRARALLEAGGLSEETDISK